MRNVASTIYLLTSAAIALGAFGHDSNAAKLAAEFAKAPALDPDVVRVTMLVWHFCSGCMLVFGAICVLSWWRLRTGARDALPVPLAIGAFYIVTGIASVAYSAKSRPSPACTRVTMGGW